VLKNFVKKLMDLKTSGVRLLVQAKSHVIHLSFSSVLALIKSLFLVK
jgi:hypothetical protein